MSSHLNWCWLCRACERVWKSVKYAHGVVIPLISSADPLKEFETADVKQNILYYQTGDAMKKSEATKLLTAYHDPRQPCSLSGVARFAQTRKNLVQKGRKVLEKD